MVSLDFSNHKIACFGSVTDTGASEATLFLLPYQSLSGTMKPTGGFFPWVYMMARLWYSCAIGIWNL